MGSLSYAIDRSANPREEVRKYVLEVLPADARLLDYSFGPGDGRGDWCWGGVMYAAVETVDAEGHPMVAMWLALYKVGRCDGWRDLCIKLEDETVGPNFDAPAQRLMRLLTPTTHTYASQWRERVAAGHEARRVGRTKWKAAIGKRVRLHSPLPYGRIGDVTEIVVVSATRWRDAQSGSLLKPPRGWQTLSFDSVAD